MGCQGEELNGMKHERLQIFSEHSLEADQLDVIQLTGGMLGAAGEARTAGAL